MNHSTASKLATVFVFFFLIVTACSTPHQSEEPSEEQEEQIEHNEPVAADGVLETVTWNLEWYGSGFSGPTDQELQTKNIVEVLDSLDADLFAFQEIADQKALDNIVQYMDKYRGFTASHVPRDQKMAFVYNTNAIDSLEAGSIEDVRETYKNDWSYYWASGRTPLFFRFNYTYQNTTREFYAVVIHGKANTSNYAESYERRQKAAEGLYYFLKDNKPDANIILLGDYNDDVDQSIYYEEGNNGQVYQETPYDEFVEDAVNFDVITKALSESGESASVNYEDLIDHITISNELFDILIQNSTEVYYNPQSYINNYGSTTSDHLPVWAKFNITTTSKSQALNQ